MRDDAARPVRLADYTPSDFVVDDIELTFTLDVESTRVVAKSAVRRLGAHDRPLVLDGERLELKRIALDAAPLAPSAYAVEPERLIVHTPPDRFTLEVETIIHPGANTALEGLYVSAGRFCTQCEPEGFRKITYALDRPDCLSRYTVRIEAEKARFPLLLSNGDPIEAGDLPGGRHYALWRDPHLKPAYLFALVAGAFDSIEDEFTTMSGKRVKLGVHVDKGDASRAGYAMDSLKRAMKWDEEVFQREYDLSVFNIVAVRDFNFGAMENKGLNIFNSSYVLADPETATDSDYEAIESVVAHEYFHNWTGNRITLRDWFQLCLKEGLTVYRDEEFSADQRSRSVQRIKDVKRLRARQFPEDSGPLAHNVRPRSYLKIDNFYTATVYEKGAEVIRLLKSLIGPEAFDKGMQLYFARCDGTAATVEDFVACFEEAGGHDLRRFMRWYDQAGTPRLNARGIYDANAKTYELTVSQTIAPTPGQTEKAPMPIPLRVGLISADGAILAPHLGDAPVANEEHLLVLDQAAQSWTFKGVARQPIPALLRGFPAPVALDDGLTTQDRLAQMAHDPDPYTRWEAGQSLARAAILSRAELIKAGQKPPPETAFAAALSREIDRAQQDPAFAALALRLPDLNDLIQIADAPDPDALFAAREDLRRELARVLRPKIEPLAAAPSEKEFSAGAEAAGRRALKAAALDLFAALGAESEAVLRQAFDAAGTMTEQMAALDALGASGLAAFDDALGAFQKRWSSSPLVMDKWFSAQAAAPRADSIARVRMLRRHPDFDIKNPNRVRSLVASFSARNLRAFHAADGEGYRFVADLAGEVDPLNPALSSRLLAPFESWRRFDETRRGHASAAMQALLARPDLSKNAHDILSRALV
ncbi:MAG TPA: aminopeptidase N [Caulobacterales bacterium]|nr:aminopeptidase N [Caulobacterales bacterium]